MYEEMIAAIHEVSLYRDASSLLYNAHRKERVPSFSDWQQWCEEHKHDIQATISFVLKKAKKEKSKTKN